MYLQRPTCKGHNMGLVICTYRQASLILELFPLSFYLLRSGSAIIRMSKRCSLDAGWRFSRRPYPIADGKALYYHIQPDTAWNRTDPCRGHATTQLRLRSRNHVYRRNRHLTARYVEQLRGRPCEACGRRLRQKLATLQGLRTETGCSGFQ